MELNFSTVPLPAQVADDLAARLTRLRKFRGWTQAELAERSGVSLGSLKRFEQKGKISLENLLALAHVLNRLGDFGEVFAVDENLEAAKRRFDQLGE